MRKFQNNCRKFINSNYFVLQKPCYCFVVAIIVIHIFWKSQKSTVLFLSMFEKVFYSGISETAHSKVTNFFKLPNAIAHFETQTHVSFDSHHQSVSPSFIFFLGFYDMTLNLFLSSFSHLLLCLLFPLPLNILKM